MSNEEANNNDKMTTSDVLESASKLVAGDRHDDYGDAKENFDKIASIWSAVLGIEVTRQQVAMCMIGVKIARATNSPEKLDSWVDMAGYASLGAVLK
jgi:hypothetical protein